MQSKTTDESNLVQNKLTDGSTSMQCDMRVAGTRLQREWMRVSKVATEREDRSNKLDVIRIEGSIETGAKRVDGCSKLRAG